MSLFPDPCIPTPSSKRPHDLNSFPGFGSKNALGPDQSTSLGLLEVTTGVGQSSPLYFSSQPHTTHPQTTPVNLRDCLWTKHQHFQILPLCKPLKPPKALFQELWAS